MTTISAPEIAESLADSEEGDTVKLTIEGVVTADKSVEIQSVARELEEAAPEGEVEEEEEEEGAPTKMPHGIAILISGKPKKA